MHCLDSIAGLLDCGDFYAYRLSQKRAFCSGSGGLNFTHTIDVGRKEWMGLSKIGL